MRWSTFFIFTYFALVLQVGLADLLGYGEQGVAPSFLLILGVYVAMAAPSMTTAFALLMLGLLSDLTRHLPTGDGGILWLIGPRALGMLAAAGAVLQLRVMMYRNSILALTLMVFIAGVFVNLVAIAMVTVRGLPWMPGDPIAMWSASDELVRQFREVVYTAVMAVPVGAVLLRLTSLWRFEPIKSKGPR